VPAGGGGASEGALVRAADMGEHTIPPIPMLCNAERGEALLWPKEPEVRRTCGGNPLREGDMDGDRVECGDDRPLRLGERNRAS
jgi:hypothetical protein